MEAKVFQDMDLGEIQELIDITSQEFTKGRLVKMSASKPMPDEEEEDREKTGPQRKKKKKNPDTRKSTSFMI